MIILEDSTKYCKQHLYIQHFALNRYRKCYIVINRYRVYKKCIHVTTSSPGIIVHSIYYGRGKVIKTKHTHMETKEIFSRPNFLNGLLMRF